MKADLDSLKPRLLDYLDRNGVNIDYSKKPPALRCPDPAHYDAHPSAVVYTESNRVYCPVCDKTWDVFAVAGLLRGIPDSDFPKQLKEVQECLGETASRPAVERKPSPASESSRKPDNVATAAKLKALPLAESLKTYTTEAVQKTADFLNGGNGVGKKICGWPIFNAAGEVEAVDYRFEEVIPEEDGKPARVKKSVFTFWYDGKRIKMAQPPYLLGNRHLLAQSPDAPALIVEGAKTSKAAEAVPGFVPVFWTGGGKKAKLCDWTPCQNRPVYILPDDDKPGEEAAADIKALLPHAVIVTPPEAARKVKARGADMVEILQIMTPEEVKAYILDAANHVKPVAAPPPEPPSAHLFDVPAESAPLAVTSPAFPFSILGTADDGKTYFLDRHGRLTALNLGGITKTQLFCLAPSDWWKVQFKDSKNNLSLDDAIDFLQETAGSKDFSTETLRGRGAWSEKDGSTCYHDGAVTFGNPSPSRIYLKMNRVDLGIDGLETPPSTRREMLKVAKSLSFETDADAIRLLCWSALAPFAGALPWRPAIFLTGSSEAGKTTIVDSIVRRLALPEIFSGGETTEAGIRQTTRHCALSVVIEEAETDTPKKKQRRDDILSLMRQSTSDDTPKAAKGTQDGRGMSFALRHMFCFVAISPEIDCVADENRLLRVTLGKKKGDWEPLRDQLKATWTKENCRGVRAATWNLLPRILETAREISHTIEGVAGINSRAAYAEALLAATWFHVWEGWQELDRGRVHEMLENFFDQVPYGQRRDESAEIIDRLLDQTVRVPSTRGFEESTLREVLAAIRDKVEGGSFIDASRIRELKKVAGRYGLGVAEDGSLLIASNHHEIKKITNKGHGYLAQFRRHKATIGTRSAYISGTTRNCLVLNGEILGENE